MALIVLCSVLFWIKNKQQANGTLQKPIEGQEGLRYKLLACSWTQLEDRKHSRYSERCNQIKPLTLLRVIAPTVLLIKVIFEWSGLACIYPRRIERGTRERNQPGFMYSSGKTYHVLTK